MGGVAYCCDHAIAAPLDGRHEVALENQSTSPRREGPKADREAKARSFPPETCHR